MLAKTALAMLSTFDSTEARVGVMVAGVELQRKLLHRLRILGEAPQAETPVPDAHKKASPCNSLRDEDRLDPRPARSCTGSPSCEHLARVSRLAQAILVPRGRARLLDIGLEAMSAEANRLRQQILNAQNRDRKKSQQALGS